MPIIEADSKSVFKEAVNDCLTRKPNQWTGDESAVVIKKLVTSIVDRNGNAVELTPEDEAMIDVMSRPTQERQVSMVRTIVEKHGATLDLTRQGLIRRAAGAAAFKIELAKAGRISDSGAAGLKDLLG